MTAPAVAGVEIFVLAVAEGGNSGLAVLGGESCVHAVRREGGFCFALAGIQKGYFAHAAVEVAILVERNPAPADRGKVVPTAGHSIVHCKTAQIHTGSGPGSLGPIADIAQSFVDCLVHSLPPAGRRQGIADLTDALPCPRLVVVVAAAALGRHCPSLTAAVDCTKQPVAASQRRPTTGSTPGCTGVYDLEPDLLDWSRLAAGR